MVANSETPYSDTSISTICKLACTSKYQPELRGGNAFSHYFLFSKQPFDSTLKKVVADCLPSMYLLHLLTVHSITCEVLNQYTSIYNILLAWRYPLVKANPY